MPSLDTPAARLRGLATGHALSPGAPRPAGARVAARAAVGLLVLLTLLLIGPAFAEATVRFQVKGKWTCDNRGTVSPIAGARVELFRERSSLLPDEKIKTRYLGADGSYDIKVKASDNFKLYVKLLLHDDDGVELEDWYSPFTWETQTGTKKSKDGAVVQLGTRQIFADNGTGTPKCAIWQGAHNAYGDYTRLVGAKPPDRDYKIQAEFPCCGVPFTTLNATQWPDNYPTGGNYSTNVHEFAHSFRHSFDGDRGHFLFDVGRFSYPQFHVPCKVTNEGFAFNEGWAEYWEGAGCSGGSDARREGDVADALSGLERCSSRPAMVRVLRENRGAIHSLAEFRDKFFRIYGARVCDPVVTASGRAEPVLSAQRLTADAKDQIADQKKLIASLSRRLRSAKARARKPGRCARGRCRVAMEKLIAPSTVSTQIQQAKLVLDRLEEGLAAARKAKFDPNALQASFGTKLGVESAEFERANQSLVLNGLSKGIREIKTEPGFKRGRSSDLFQTLNRQRTILRRARKRRDTTPSGVADLVAPPSAPRDSVKKVNGR